MGTPGTYTRATLLFENLNTNAKATCALWYLLAGGTPPTLATVVAYANSFKTAYSSAVAPTLSPLCQVTNVTLKYVSGGSEIEGQNSNGAIDGTAASGENLPEEDVVCIQRRTGLQGRNKRGRVFWPFVQEANQLDGRLTDEALSLYLNVATMIKSDVTHAGNIFHPYTLDHKNSVLVPIVQAGVVREICSRRDRRFPKVLTSIRV